MKKIRVVHHSKTLGFSGTDRTAQLMCKYLAQSDRYEPFLVYRESEAGMANVSRLYEVSQYLDQDHLIPYTHTHQDNPSSPFLPKDDNLAEVLSRIDPDIFHIHRSGYHEWPGMRFLAPRAKFVETNIFGYPDQTANTNIDMHIYISDYIRRLAMSKGGPDGPILYNGVEMPAGETQEWANRCRENLLERFSLRNDAILLGRVGRADNFDPIALNALARVVPQMPHAHYLVVNGCNAWKDTAWDLGIQDNVHFLDPIISDDDLSAFYAGLDIYAHARHDGECCPCNIQEAMMHGLAVVSHISKLYNGQIEIIGNAGFVVPIDDDESYADVLRELIGDKTRLLEFAAKARRRAMGKFEASCIVDVLMRLYDHVLQQ
jgi:glycosyltransferase involved in cell wall biosynthesis